jgi:hypothetical protein
MHQVKIRILAEVYGALVRYKNLVDRILVREMELITKMEAK